MTERQILEQKIRDLEANLGATDYKVIKCSEAQILGETMPYDMEAIHAERQAIRDEINRLQKELDALED